MGCVKLHILNEQYKSTELKVSYINKKLTLKNSVKNVRRKILLRYVDPDGRDEWDINEQGVVTWLRESEKHTLYSLKTGKSITLKNRDIFDQLTEQRTDFKGSYSITGNIGDAFKVFKFGADNTDVEWRIDGYRTKSSGNEYFVGTSHDYESVNVSHTMDRFNELDMVFNMHSHLESRRGLNTREASDSDMSGIRYMRDRFEVAGMKHPNVWFNAGGRNTVFPNHYIYHVPSKGLYHYTPWSYSIFIRNVNNASGLYRNLGF